MRYNHLIEHIFNILKSAETPFSRDVDHMIIIWQISTNFDLLIHVFVLYKILRVNYEHQKHD